MFAAGLTGIVVFGLLWELVVRVFDVQPFILMAPSRIVAELLDHPRFYLEAAGVTARQATVGLLIALGVAILLGAGLAASRFAEHATQPVLVLILVAPWVAYFTSIVVWLGSGDPPVIFLVAFVTTPAFVFATVAGLRSADPAARELLALGRRQLVGGALAAPAAVGAAGGAGRHPLQPRPRPCRRLLRRRRQPLQRRASAPPAGGRSTPRTGRCCGRPFSPPSLLGVAGLGIISVIERTLLRWHVSQRRSLR